MTGEGPARTTGMLATAGPISTPAAPPRTPTTRRARLSGGLGGLGGEPTGPAPRGLAFYPRYDTPWRTSSRPITRRQVQPLPIWKDGLRGRFIGLHIKDLALSPGQPAGTIDLDGTRWRSSTSTRSREQFRKGRRFAVVEGPITKVVWLP